MIDGGAVAGEFGRTRHPITRLKRPFLRPVVGVNRIDFLVVRLHIHGGAVAGECGATVYGATYTVAPSLESVGLYHVTTVGSNALQRTDLKFRYKETASFQQAGATRSHAQQGWRRSQGGQRRERDTETETGAKMMSVQMRHALKGHLGAAACKAMTAAGTRACTAEAIDADRQKLKNARRVVVKVGTAVVANSDGTMALSRMGALVESLKELRAEGREVMLVSSGAVGLGRVQLGLTKEQISNPENFIDKQACAAAGQEMLMSMYHMMFSRLGVRAAQVLITQGDLLDRQKYMLLTDTLDKLTELGTVPIVNENDVVTGGSKGPQVFSDNDNLSAILASGASADGLALLTDVEAVFTKPPDEPGAERIKVWGKGSEVVLGEKSGMGRGGMGSKINAAVVAAVGGVTTCVASGYDLGNIRKVFAGEDIGTLFPGRSRPNKRQRWLTLATGSAGSITVSDQFHEAMLAGRDPSLRFQVQGLNLGARG